MNSRIISYLFIILLAAANASYAAVHCLPTAAGNGSGSDWDNAADGDTVTFTRGETYYIAAGSYGSRNFNTAVSGTQYITIKKATETDHGSDTGWSSAYGTGTAQFSPSTISTSYWEIDGQYGALDGTFGIRFERVNSNGTCLTVSNNVDHINLVYVELKEAGYSRYAWNAADCLYLNGNAIHDINVSYCWLHNANRTAVFVLRAYNLTFDHCWFTEVINMDCYGVHGEAFSLNETPDTGQNTISNSYFRNIEGSGWIVFNNNFGSTAENHNWDIYNNVFYVDANHRLDGWVDDTNCPGASCTDGLDPALVAAIPETCNSSYDDEPQAIHFTGTDGIIAGLNSGDVPELGDIHIYGNTFLNLYQTNVVGITRANLNETGDNICRNNLDVRSSGNALWTANTATNNTTSNNTGLVANYPSNATLTQATPISWYALGSPFNVDISGTTRAIDGTGDVGAYEFDDGAPTSATSTSSGSIGGAMH